MPHEVKESAGSVGKRLSIEEGTMSESNVLTKLLGRPQL